MLHTDKFLAIDLGATSGRTFIASISGGRLRHKELTRFANNQTMCCGHIYWDIFALYGEIIKALQIVSESGISISSIGIDTWGVDFVCVGADGSILANPISYRDPYTDGAMEKYFAEVMDMRSLYAKTGIQFMNFNTLFQLYSMRNRGNSALASAETILFLPDALAYMLTGEKVCEYTIASTSQLINPFTGRFDNDLLDSLGLSPDRFGRMVQPGTVIGTLSEDVQHLTGLGAVPVVAVAGHDTASAVAAVPARNERFAYLSSGTWSLMGIESKVPIVNEQSYSMNFTNEGGINSTVRFLKNITGMWIYERCRQEWTDAPKSHAELQDEAFRQPPFRCFINPDDPVFAHPQSMTEAVKNYCKTTGQYVPTGYAEMCRCIFESLALRYRQVFSLLKDMANFPIEVLHIIGGGSKNHYLNQFTADALGVKVVAGPQECTAIGNIMMQWAAINGAADVWKMRRIIADSVETKEFNPIDTVSWERAGDKYNKVSEKAK
jgi:rhamnulokinase